MSEDDSFSETMDEAVDENLDDSVNYTEYNSIVETANDYLDKSKKSSEHISTLVSLEAGCAGRSRLSCI
jgi:hypothetical protein